MVKYKALSGFPRDFQWLFDDFHLIFDDFHWIFDDVRWIFNGILDVFPLFSFIKRVFWMVFEPQQELPGYLDQLGVSGWDLLLLGVEWATGQEESHPASYSQ